MADKDLDDELVGEDIDDEEIEEPGDDDLSDDVDEDDPFLSDDLGDDDGSDDDDDDVETPARRPRRRAPVRPGTIGGVARTRLDRPEHAQKAWDELTAHANKELEPVPYSIRDSFEKDTRISHPKFGIGHVVEIVGPQKIEVLFADSLRMMVQNR